MKFYGFIRATTITKPTTFASRHSAHILQALLVWRAAFIELLIIHNGDIISGYYTFFLHRCYGVLSAVVFFWWAVVQLKLAVVYVPQATQDNSATESFTAAQKS